MRDLYIERATAISPLGQSLEEIWSNLLAGKAKYGCAELPHSRIFFAAETVKNSASDISIYAALFYNTIRALVADLNIDRPVDAIFFATAVGNLAYIENEIYFGRDVNVKILDFCLTERIFSDTPACGAKTRFVCVPTGCCAGIQAAGLARKVMPILGLHRAIVMSIDFGMTPLGFMAFDQINATTPFDTTITSSPSRPFCRERGGFLFADGGGAILVSTEPEDTNMPRITGYGCVSSAYHMTDIATDGGSIKSSIQKAMNEAQLSPDKVSHVNLHASGTEQNDTAEYQALIDIFGSSLPPITAFKGNHGHALGGANMIELALCWKMMREQKVPRTPVGLDVNAYDEVSPRATSVALKSNVILKTASGFGGIHASLVMEG